MIKKKKRLSFSANTIDTAKQQASDTSSMGSQGPTMGPQSPQTPVLTNYAIQHGADPKVLDEAKQKLGNQDYNGLCEAFVEKVGGQMQRFPSAIAAWNGSQNKTQGTKGIQPGDAVYFSANKGNGGYGHTGIYAGNGQFVSATPSGVKQLPIDEWVKLSGQQLLGYVSHEKV